MAINKHRSSQGIFDILKFYSPFICKSADLSWERLNKYAFGKVLGIHRNSDLDELEQCA